MVLWLAGASNDGALTCQPTVALVLNEVVIIQVLYVLHRKQLVKLTHRAQVLHKMGEDELSETRYGSAALQPPMPASSLLKFWRGSSH